MSVAASTKITWDDLLKIPEDNGRGRSSMVS